MPVTKTAKRALRSSKRKEAVNKATVALYEVAIRSAKKSKTAATVNTAVSLVDRAAKRGIIHKNKAAHLKSMLAKLAKPTKATSKKH